MQAGGRAEVVRGAHPAPPAPSVLSPWESSSIAAQAGLEGAELAVEEGRKAGDELCTRGILVGDAGGVLDGDLPDFVSWVLQRGDEGRTGESGEWRRWMK